jgi:hypothetical protein
MFLKKIINVTKTSFYEFKQKSKSAVVCSFKIDRFICISEYEQFVCAWAVGW